MPLGPTGFQKALSASPSNPKKEKRSNPRRRRGWDRGRVRGIGGFPSSPGKGMGVSSCPVTPTPRSTAPGGPPIISFLRKGPEGSGARAESTPDFARLLHFRPARPPFPGAPGALAQSPVRVPVDPALRALPVATSAAASRFLRPGLAAPHLAPYSRLP